MTSAIIVGPAPSLDTQAIPSLHEAATTVVALNRSYRAWANYPNLNPDKIFAVDVPARFSDCLPELQEINPKSTLAVPKANSSNPLRKRWQDAGLANVEEHDLPDPIAPKSALLLALQILAEEHDTIGLIGIDLRIHASNRYFYEHPLQPSQKLKANIKYQSQCDWLEQWIPKQSSKLINLGFKHSQLARLMPTASLGEFIKAERTNH